MKITDIYAREIIASGGTPSIQVTITIDNQHSGSASVSFGASAGSHEAFVMFDNDPDRYDGKGMLKSVEHIHTSIKDSIVGQTFDSQKDFDTHLIALDGTPHKSHLGGNTLLGVSMAYAYAKASKEGVQMYEYMRKEFGIPLSDFILPKPMMVVIEGGAHADNSTDFQEYLIAITKEATTQETVRAGLEMYQKLKEILLREKLSVNVGNEGAFAPSGIKTNEKPLEFITQAIEKAGYKDRTEAGIAIDVAASEFAKGDSYHLTLEDKTITSDDLIDYVCNFYTKYPIVAVEDVLGEDDWQGWSTLVERSSKDKIIVVGDDLTVTNSNRLQKAVDMKALSGIILKFNQAGTMTETIEAAILAMNNNIVTIPSHRGGGETNDTSLVDLAVALNSPWIKVGPTRGERVCKYNRLMEIEEQLK